MGIPVPCIVMDMYMSDTGCKFLRPFEDRDFRIAVCVPHIQAQLKLWMIYDSIYIQKEPPVFIQDIFHDDLRAFPVF